jgi:hypothetical protein
MQSWTTVRVDAAVVMDVIRLRYTVAALATAIVASIVSCNKSATAPSPSQELPTPDPTIQSIRIDGPSGLTPGGTAQYTATGQFSNGSTRDVTATTTWRSSDSDVLSIASGGRANAGRPGQVVVAAENSGRRAGIDVLVLAPGTFRLTGTVSDAGTPISDATVDLLDGSRAVMSTRSDDSGTYRLLGVAGNIEIRASKAGYVTQVNRLTVSGNTTSDFGLTSDQTGAVDGTYRLTLTASPGCPVSGYLSLPSDVRTRKYTATVRQMGSRLEVELSDAALLKASFAGQAEGTRVSFDLRGVERPNFYYYFDDIERNTDLLEQVSPRDTLEVVGHVDGTVSQTGISGTLKGLLALVSSPPFRTLDALCNDHHSFVMVRR